MAAYLRIRRDMKLIERSDLNTLPVSDLTLNIINEKMIIQKIKFLNVNHLSHDKWKLIKPYFAEAEIMFLMECWTVPPDYPGYTKYTDTSIYFNTIYIKSNMDVNVELVDFGFKLAGSSPLYCLYIPPGHRNFKLPEGNILGDLNWNSNRLTEPMYHEKGNLYTGMCSVNIPSSYEFIQWSDHNVGSVMWNNEAAYPMDIDKQRTTKAIIKSAKQGILKVPLKRRNRRLINRNMNFRARLYHKSNAKIYDAAILTKKQLKPWMEILNHSDNKISETFQGNILVDKCMKLKTKARDYCGINVNMVLCIWKNMAIKEKLNIIDGLRPHTNIKGLLLKKKEFQSSKFNIKDFRIISIMPTFVKLKESYLNFNEIDKFLQRSFVGFRPKRSIDSFPRFINSAVT